MPADLPERLRQAAMPPSRALPFASIEQRVRGRRRRRYIARSATAVVIAGLLVTLVALTEHDQTSVRTVGPASPLTTSGIHVELPTGWTESAVDATATPAELLAVGTRQRPTPRGGVYCVGLDNAFVTISEVQPGQQPPSLSGGPGASRNQAVRRPDDFATTAPLDSSQCRIPGSSATTLSYLFTDHGRVLFATVTLGESVTDQRRADAFAVLNSLRIGN
jgi:hypothetical protein